MKPCHYLSHTSWACSPGPCSVLLWLSGPAWPLLVLRGISQHPLVGQVSLECVEDMELLIWPQGHELLNQLAGVRAPGRESDQMAPTGAQQLLGLIIQVAAPTSGFSTNRGQRGLGESINKQ